MPAEALVRKTTRRPLSAGAGVGVSMAIKPSAVKAAIDSSRPAVS